MRDRFSKELEKSLKSAGWFPGRQTDSVVAELKFSLHPAGEKFVREFGGLLLGGIIHVSAEEANHSYAYRDRLAAANLPNCLPVGSSWFWCEGELWMDEMGRVYQADGSKMAMVSERIEDALEILVIRKTSIPTDLPKWRIAPKPPNPYDLGVVYDKAEYHMTGARGDALSWEHASGCALFMLRWLMDQELVSPHFVEQSDPLLEEYRSGKLPLFKLYEEKWDMAFSSEMLTDEGNAFARAYFNYDCGQYTKDLWAALNLSKNDYPLYNEESYGRVKPLLDTRYAEWKAGSLQTRPYKQPKEWPKWKIYLVGFLLGICIFTAVTLVGRLIETVIDPK